MLNFIIILLWDRAKFHHCIMWYNDTNNLTDIQKVGLTEKKKLTNILEKTDHTNMGLGWSDQCSLFYLKNAGKRKAVF